MPGIVLDKYAHGNMRTGMGGFHPIRYEFAIHGSANSNQILHNIETALDGATCPRATLAVPVISRAMVRQGLEEPVHVSKIITKWFETLQAFIPEPLQ